MRDLAMQAAGGLADNLLQARFHIQMNVFQRLGKLELSFADFRQDLIDALSDGGFVRRRDHAGLRQHGGVGFRSSDVLCREALVHVDGRVYRLHDLIGHGREPAAPHGIAVGIFRHEPATRRFSRASRTLCSGLPASGRAAGGVGSRLGSGPGRGACGRQPAGLVQDGRVRAAGP